MIAKEKREGKESGEQECGAGGLAENGWENVAEQETTEKRPQGGGNQTGGFPGEHSKHRNGQRASRAARASGVGVEGTGGAVGRKPESAWDAGRESSWRAC